MSVKLLTENHLEFLSLKGGCRSWSESALVKMPHCWKSHVMAQLAMNSYLLTFAEVSACEERINTLPTSAVY